MGLTLTPKQKEYVRNCNRRWNIKEGAVRSGKTFLDIFYTIPSRVLNASNGIIFLIGNTQITLETNILKPMREIYGRELVGNINKSTSEIKLFGKTVNAVGADKESTVRKIHGATVSYCYGDEITTWNEKVFDELKARISAKGACFDGTCNPDTPRHWFRKFLLSDADIYKQNYVIEDNPHLTKDFVENLKKEYEGTIYYDRYILGKWALAEGLVYSCYNVDSDPIDKVEEKLTGQVIISCDYGTANPCVFLMWEEGISGTWYLTKEYYYSGRENIKQKTDEEYCDDFISFIGNKYPSTILVDPSALSFITALNRRGFAVQGAENSVLSGIRITMNLLNSKRIKILKTCTNTLQEFEAYSWNPKSNEDEPIKDNDHCMDALRYFAIYIDSIGNGGTLPDNLSSLTRESYWNGF